MKVHPGLYSVLFTGLLFIITSCIMFYMLYKTHIQDIPNYDVGEDVSIVKVDSIKPKPFKELSRARKEVVYAQKHFCK